MLSEQVKSGLAERFCPILCIDPDEPSRPVSPLDYVGKAALWASTPPHHPRPSWGALEPVIMGFSQVPLVPHGAIALDASGDLPGLVDPSAEGEPRERWLALDSWQDGQAVRPNTVNRRARLAGPELEQPWYVCDVWTFDDLVEQLGGKALAERFGIEEERPPLVERLAVVSFLFLFPGHRQPRRSTAHDPAMDPWAGDYEGDWCHFSVIARCETGDLASAAIGDFIPLSGGFGQRYRGNSADRDEFASERVLLRAWPTLMFVDEHPVVMASAGIHNLHPHDPPRNPDGGIDIQPKSFGDELGGTVDSFAGDLVEQPGAKLFALKVVAGAAAGGIFGPIGAVAGAIVGGIAAGAEVAEGEGEGFYEVPKLDPSPALDPPGENPTFEDAVDLEKQTVVKPAFAANPPFFDPASGVSHDWLPSGAVALKDGTMVRSIQAKLLAGSGRWGVRCDQDGLLTRSGMTLPAYRNLVLDALLKQV